MKLLSIIIAGVAAVAQIRPSEPADNTLASVAAQIEDLKFFINDITKSRDEESKHLQARLIELEDRFAQQKLIQAGAIPAQPVDPKILAANEEKAEKSYRHKVLNLISGI